MSEHCCQSALKMWELTSPDASIPMHFTGDCANCGGAELYTYWVPESVWRKIVPEKWWDETVCAKCFHELAQIEAKRRRKVLSNVSMRLNGEVEGSK